MASVFYVHISASLPPAHSRSVRNTFLQMSCPSPPSLPKAIIFFSSNLTDFHSYTMSVMILRTHTHPLSSLYLEISCLHSFTFGHRRLGSGVLGKLSVNGIDSVWFTFNSKPFYTRRFRPP